MHIAELDLAGTGTQLDAALFLRSGFEQAHGAAQRGEVLLQRHRHAAERFDGIEKAVQVGHEHDHVAGVRRRSSTIQPP